jgi:hypothetical protein
MYEFDKALIIYAKGAVVKIVSENHFVCHCCYTAHMYAEINHT